MEETMMMMADNDNDDADPEARGDHLDIMICKSNHLERMVPWCIAVASLITWAAYTSRTRIARSATSAILALPPLPSHSRWKVAEVKSRDLILPVATNQPHPRFGVYYSLWIPTMPKSNLSILSPLVESQVHLV
jgi:hypothetical protein